MKLAVRAATDDDLAPITAIYAEQVLHGTGTFELEPPDVAEMGRRLAEVHARDLPWLVAERGGRVIGYAYCAPFRLRPAYRYCVEVSVYIDAVARGQGVGRVLLDALVDDARAKGLRQMLAVIGDSANQGSIALHAACGFESAGIWRAVGWKFERWIDVVLMQLELDPARRPPTAPGLKLP